MAGIKLKAQGLGEGTLRVPPTETKPRQAARTKVAERGQLSAASRRWLGRESGGEAGSFQII